jgi:hypothetical protein
MFRKIKMFIRKLFRIDRPSEVVEYKERLTKCDTCEYLDECLSENLLLDCTINADSVRHFIPMRGVPCKRMDKVRELFGEDCV